MTGDLSLDVLFEQDESVMPLMSAFKIWSKLERTVADESLFNNITILLGVQVILQISPTPLLFLFVCFIEIQC